jgi:hypothetical protein
MTAKNGFHNFDYRFEVSLGRLKSMTSISNMPIAENGMGVKM